MNQETILNSLSGNMDTKIFDEIGNCFYEEPRVECKDLADRNLEYVDRGQNRLVYDVPGKNQIVKFAIDPNANPSSNDMEILIDEKIPPNLRGWIPNIEDHDERNTWLTMEKFKTPRQDGIERIPWDDEKEFKKDLEESGWRCSDIRPSNFGKDKDGQWKFFDFPGCRSL